MCTVNAQETPLLGLLTKKVAIDTNASGDSWRPLSRQLHEPYKNIVPLMNQGKVLCAHTYCKASLHSSTI